MEIAERTEADITILSVTGRLDAATSATFSEKIAGLIDSGRRDFIVDLGGLDYISSSGLRVFLVALKRLNGVKGRLVLAALKDHIREVFDLAGFSPCFPMHPSTAEAVKALPHSGKG
jgi:anti-sigma B factor antagonist